MVSVVRRPRRRVARSLHARTRNASVATTCSTTTTCCSTGARSPHRARPATRCATCSTTCSSTSTRTPTRSKSTSCARCARRRRLTAVGDDAQAIYGFRAATVDEHVALRRALPRRDPDHARAELSLDAGHPRRRQRGARAIVGALPQAAHVDARRRCATRCSSPCRDEAAQSAHVAAQVLALREQGCDCATRRCCSAPAITATRSSSSSCAATFLS